MCQLFGNLMLFPLNVVQEGLDLLDLRIEYLLEELRGELLTDGEFVGPLDGLVEVATKPAEFLLMLQIEVGHAVDGIDFATCGGVVELTDGIANHCRDGLVTGCLSSEEGFFVGREANPEAFCLLSLNGFLSLICYRVAR